MYVCMMYIDTEYQKRHEKHQYGVTKSPSGRMQLPMAIVNTYNTLPLPSNKKKKKKSSMGPGDGSAHLKITSTFSYQADEEMRETQKAQQAVLIPKVQKKGK